MRVSGVTRSPTPGKGLTNHLLIVLSVDCEFAVGFIISSNLEKSAVINITLWCLHHKNLKIVRFPV